jgi:hypothetical protein
MLHLMPPLIAILSNLSTLMAIGRNSFSLHLSRVRCTSHRGNRERIKQLRVYIYTQTPLVNHTSTPNSRIQFLSLEVIMFLRPRDLGIKPRVLNFCTFANLDV